MRRLSLSYARTASGSGTSTTWPHPSTPHLKNALTYSPLPPHPKHSSPDPPPYWHLSMFMDFPFLSFLTEYLPSDSNRQIATKLGRPIIELLLCLSVTFGCLPRLVHRLVPSSRELATPERPRSIEGKYRKFEFSVVSDNQILVCFRDSLC